MCKLTNTNHQKMGFGSRAPPPTNKVRVTLVSLAIKQQISASISTKEKTATNLTHYHRYDHRTYQLCQLGLCRFSALNSTINPTNWEDEYQGKDENTTALPEGMKMPKQLPTMTGPPWMPPSRKTSHPH